MHSYLKLSPYIASLRNPLQLGKCFDVQFLVSAACNPCHLRPGWVIKMLLWLRTQLLSSNLQLPGRWPGFSHSSARPCITTCVLHVGQGQGRGHVAPSANKRLLMCPPHSEESGLKWSALPGRQARIDALLSSPSSFDDQIKWVQFHAAPSHFSSGKPEGALGKSLLTHSELPVPASLQVGKGRPGSLLLHIVSSVI